MALSGNSYQALKPTRIVHDDRVSVIYFPYLRALDRDLAVLRRDFRDNMPAIVAAVGEFTGRNTLLTGDSATFTRFTYPPPRPTVADLQVRMGVGPESARELLLSIDRIRDNWQIVEDAYARLPQSLCHNDIAPGNAVYDDSTTTFSDFGMAAAGPMGSDLHTIIRCSGQAMRDPDQLKACSPHTSRRCVRITTPSPWTRSDWRRGRPSTSDTQT